METKNKKITFGKHSGELWTRVPIDYLKWLANQEDESENVKMAEAEIERRGGTYPDVKVSNHAIDRASLRRYKTYEQMREKDEGLYSWLCKIAIDALENGEKDGDKYTIHGITLVIKEGKHYPLVKTIF